MAAVLAPVGKETEKKMEALFIDSPGSTRTGEIGVQEPGESDVLLRIHTVGFCGSDLSTYRGLNPLVTYPRVPGHEIAATIERVGSRVPDTLSEGMNVTVVPYTACGECAACARGRAHACEHNQTMGVQRDGALTQLVTVPWEKVVSAEGVPPRQLALVEPLAVGFHAVARGRVESSDTVAVIGCGAVGLGAVAGARERGATVIAIDIDDAKLRLARAMGATHTVNSATGDLREQLRAVAAEGPDVVIEAVGLAQTFRAAVDEVAFTGRVVYIGYAKDPVSYDTSLFVKKELDILGSRNATAEDFAAVIELLREKRVPAADLVTRTVSFAGAGDALARWDDVPGEVTRIHVDFDASGEEEL